MNLHPQMAAAAADTAPAWWIGTVTKTELRAPGIAVLTVRPDQPLPYLPGQHISVQTLHWPRQWRTYSIANAPRPDGTLSLHVRAVKGGMVSHALVHHVAAGDPLVIGAPAGTMTFSQSGWWPRFGWITAFCSMFGAKEPVRTS